MLLFMMLTTTWWFKPPKQGRAQAQDSYRRMNAASAASAASAELAYQKWVQSFRAANPAFQPYCMEVLINSTRFPDKGGQHNQDIFLFQNLFRSFAVQGRKGFYLESGANDAYYLSTSMFFDKCLGWDGLCVEPQTKFHKASCALSWLWCQKRQLNLGWLLAAAGGQSLLRPLCTCSQVHSTAAAACSVQHVCICDDLTHVNPSCSLWLPCCVIMQALQANRSCTLVPECISAKKEVMSMSGEDATARVTPAAAGGGGSSSNDSSAAPTINCAPLSDILARYAGSAKQRVDLWILDVEGFEMKILEGTNFADINVDAVMVEDLLMLPKPDVLDLVMVKNGFLKFAELALDSVFVRRGHPAAISNMPMWYPPGFDKEVELKTQHVRTNLCGYLKKAWGATRRSRRS